MSKFVTLLKNESIAFQQEVPHFNNFDEIVQWMDKFLIDSGLMSSEDELCVTEDC